MPIWTYVAGAVFIIWTVFGCVATFAGIDNYLNDEEFHCSLTLLFISFAFVIVSVVTSVGSLVGWYLDRAEAKEKKRNRKEVLKRSTNRDDVEGPPAATASQATKVEPKPAEPKAGENDDQTSPSPCCKTKSGGGILFVPVEQVVVLPPIKLDEEPLTPPPQYSSEGEDKA